MRDGQKRITIFIIFYFLLIGLFILAVAGKDGCELFCLVLTKQILILIVVFGNQVSYIGMDNDGPCTWTCMSLPISPRTLPPATPTFD